MAVSKYQYKYLIAWFLIVAVKVGEDYFCAFIAELLLHVCQRENLAFFSSVLILINVKIEVFKYCIASIWFQQLVELVFSNQFDMW